MEAVDEFWFNNWTWTFNTRVWHEDEPGNFNFDNFDLSGNIVTLTFGKVKKIGLRKYD